MDRFCGAVLRGPGLITASAVSSRRPRIFSYSVSAGISQPIRSSHMPSIVRAKEGDGPGGSAHRKRMRVENVQQRCGFWHRCRGYLSCCHRWRWRRLARLLVVDGGQFCAMRCRLAESLLSQWGRSIRSFMPPVTAERYPCRSPISRSTASTAGSVD